MASPPPGPGSPNRAGTPTFLPLTSANSFRERYLVPVVPGDDQPGQSSADLHQTRPGSHGSEQSQVTGTGSETTKVSTHQSTSTFPSHIQPFPSAAMTADVKDTSSEHASREDSTDENGDFEPIRTSNRNSTITSKRTSIITAKRNSILSSKRNSMIRPEINPTLSGKMTEDDLFRVVSRRRTTTSVRPDSVATANPDEEQAEIERLMSRMFGRTRQAQSEDEKTRHAGLVFKNLTVKGMGLGAALQATLGDPFMGLPRLFKGLVRGGKGVASKPPVRPILDDFTGSVRPGEMLLVLGRPGSGCSTFLKALANQRSGYVSVEGDVSYGGTDAKTMAKNYRGEIVYNPEDDLHYATLSVKRTLTFALKTRTPGKASRNEGESRAAYVKEFLRVVAKLFWIEHTSSYSSGNESVRYADS